MSLSLTDIAALSAAVTLSGGRTNVRNADARALATATVRNVRAERIADAERAAETRMGYANCGQYSHNEKALCLRCETGRQNVLMRHVWARSSRVRSAIRSADAAARDAHMRRDHAALYDAVLRAHRLSRLSTALDVRAATVGRFSLSYADMRVSTSRFLVKATWRRFMFAGGRDRVSSAFTDEDVLQGAFVRAIDAGDAMFGVPLWGPLFRHVQAERAHLTRVAGAEWRATQDALHGIRATEAAYPATDDKHAMRRLGTVDAFGRPFGTVETHRRALAIAHVAAERENVAHAVTVDARNVAILAGDARSFPRIMADVLMRGATLAEISDALGLTVETIRTRVFTERDAAMSTGIDHSADESPESVAAERDIDMAQMRHAETLTSRYVAIATQSGIVGYAARHMTTARIGALRMACTPRDADDIRNRARRHALMVRVADAGKRATQDGYRAMATTGDMERDAYRIVRMRAERDAIPYGEARTARMVASGIIRASLDVRVAESFATYADMLDGAK